MIITKRFLYLFLVAFIIINSGCRGTLNNSKDMLKGGNKSPVISHGIKPCDVIGRINVWGAPGSTQFSVTIDTCQSLRVNKYEGQSMNRYKLVLDKPEYEQIVTLWSSAFSENITKKALPNFADGTGVRIQFLENGELSSTELFKVRSLNVENKPQLRALTEKINHLVPEYFRVY